MADMKPAPPFLGIGGGDRKGGDQKKEQSGGGFFKHKTDAPVQPADMSDVASQLVNLNRRLRVLEERYDGLRKKTQLIEQNILKQSKDVQREVKTTNSDMLDMRKDLEDLRSKARLIVKELMSCAKQDEVKVLEKYINLWEPVNFVTRNEVEKIVQDAIDSLLQQTPETE